MLRSNKKAHLIEVVGDPNSVTIDFALRNQCFRSILDEGAINDGSV